MKNVKMTSIKTTARTAGFLYLLLIPLGVFAILYVPKLLIVTGNMATTASNILANEFLFRLGIVSAIICALVKNFIKLAAITGIKSDGLDKMKFSDITTDDINPTPLSYSK